MEMWIMQERVPVAGHNNTIKLPNARKNTPAVTHTWLSLKDKGWVDGLTSTTADETPHDTHFHTIHQSKPIIFLSLFTLTQHTQCWGHRVIASIYLFGDCMVGTLSVGTFKEACLGFKKTNAKSRFSFKSHFHIPIVFHSIPDFPAVSLSTLYELFGITFLLRHTHIHNEQITQNHHDTQSISSCCSHV